jgi:hypothetical protein
VSARCLPGPGGSARGGLPPALKNPRAANKNHEIHEISKNSLKNQKCLENSKMLKHF